MVIIAKKQARPLNPIQFNIIAIIFVLGFMPFAVAFISSAGGDSSEEWSSTMQPRDGNVIYPFTTSRILDNGGVNYTDYYQTNNYYFNNDSLDCIYIVDGFCEGFYDDSTQPELTREFFLSYTAREANVYPFRFAFAHQSHASAGSNQYAGASGSEIFSYFLEPYFLNNIEQQETLDSLRIWSVDGSQTNLCNYAGFTNITYTAEIEFYYGNDSVKFENFEFETDNRYEFRGWDSAHGTFSNLCAIGFVTEFDLSGFESLELNVLNNGDWDNTSIRVSYKNFEREDGQNFADTDLPFAGADSWIIGLESKSLNPVEASFIIKTGTLLLSVITLVIGIASTPYWDPFRNFFSGRL